MIVYIYIYILHRPGPGDRPVIPEDTLRPEATLRFENELVGPLGQIRCVQTTHSQNAESHPMRARRSISVLSGHVLRNGAPKRTSRDDGRGLLELIKPIRQVVSRPPNDLVFGAHEARTASPHKACKRVGASSPRRWLDGSQKWHACLSCGPHQNSR